MKANTATVFSSISSTKAWMTLTIPTKSTLPPSAVSSVYLCTSNPTSWKVCATALASFSVFLRRRSPP